MPSTEAFAVEAFATVALAVFGPLLSLDLGTGQGP